VVPDGVFKEQQ